VNSLTVSNTCSKSWRESMKDCDRLAPLDAISMDIAFAHVRWDSTRHSLQQMTSWSTQKYSNGNSSCFRQDWVVIWVWIGFLDMSIRWCPLEIFMARWFSVQSVHSDSSQLTHQQTDVFLFPRSLHGSHRTLAIPLKYIFHYYNCWTKTGANWTITPTALKILCAHYFLLFIYLFLLL
jgi:hypothetical protein